MSEQVAEVRHTQTASEKLVFKRRLRFNLVGNFTRTWGLAIDPQLQMASLFLGRRQVMLTWWREIVQ